MKTYENPFAGGSDPFAMLDDNGWYYVYTSGLHLYRSKDLVNYEDLGKFYEEKEEDWFDRYESAPECYKFGGRYYIFYTPNEKYNPTGELENGRVAVLVGDSPEGPFGDYLGRPLFDPGYAVIDAHVYHEDGRYYLYWSRTCYHHPVGPDDLEESWIYGCEMKSDFTGLIGTPRLMTRPEQEWEGRTVPAHKRRWNEGMFVLKHGDTYYMTFSSDTFEDYAVGYATAKHPLGPWTKAEENPILEGHPEIGVYAPGHNSFVWSKDGTELFMVYHMVTDKEMTSVPLPPRPFAPVDPDARKRTDYALQHAAGYDFMDAVPCYDKRRKIAIDRVRFTDDGKLVLEGPTVTPQKAPSGNE